MKDVSTVFCLTSATTFAAMTAQDITGLVITILTGLASIAFIIYKWYKEAKKDGQITKDEIKDLIDQVIEKSKDTIDKIDKGN